ncbi:MULTISPECIES: histidine phosphatase family protein [unclassified Pseudonocardia]|uniref:histidine phosphatase family protein n=1 Tax=unclassified Pseudonocardia TaxID=2619320 RepID=UPI0001FFEEE2|nr:MULTISPECIES: histidine phosphatase family protein [unclassified Pseudonocardia]ALE74627.1 phosphoglycerate mutase [Pseudonocardia sp. EC080625-04]ALL78054.1 phosphoglycerate mutase [Pseudonocardia sp. EC080610-09]ALL80965.1 phosphoglycerate mutase [Pseudonocardia sp. EC080619-01]OLM17000.1 Phosphoglycerate mutase [Pseudonocardia sp. Ae707_Ps1]
MTTLILLRHGRSTANTAGVLAGRTPGVELDDRGREQAAKVVDRLADLPIASVVTSPLTRCRETVAPLAAARGLEPVVEDDLAEVDYGSWTGRKISELTSEDLWKVVQAHPSAAVFPDGESLAGMQARAVAGVRRHVARVRAEHGDDAIVLACSHGDVIKAVLADALACHLDNFQRIVVDTCSVSVVAYTQLRPFVARMNEQSGDVASLIPRPAEEKPSSDAVVGGATNA